MASQERRGGRSIQVSARDGLRLHATCYEAPGSHGLPVLCLAGLTRNGRDFHDLAAALSSGARARTVYALDCRGRGKSEHDRNWRNYSIPYETHDVIDVAAALGLHGVHIVGTSRGGLIAMVLAAIQPTIIATVVLNDIGPVIERDGLSRISGYVGRTPLPATWSEAAEIVASINGRAFPDVTAQQWEDVARAWFNETDGRPAPGYDPRIGRSISAAAGPIPELWPQFQALGGVPLLAVRGESSDILSAATHAEMLRRHPNCAGLVVPRQGHAPLIKDDRTILAIDRFIAVAEAGEAVAGRDFGGRQ